MSIVPEMRARNKLLFVSLSNTADSTKTFYNVRPKSTLLQYFRSLLKGIPFFKITDLFTHSGFLTMQCPLYILLNRSDLKHKKFP